MCQLFGVFRNTLYASLILRPKNFSSLLEQINIHVVGSLLCIVVLTLGAVEKERNS